MRPIGFSTGALAKGDFRRALQLLAPFRLPAVELSALRLNELPRLVDAANDLDLTGYRYVSVHAPSYFVAAEERYVASQLAHFAARDWPIVLHPDAIFTDSLWLDFGDRILLENNDKRKSVGRTDDELKSLFDAFRTRASASTLGMRGKLIRQ